MKKILKARKGGFTLVELLIVIMIIAILAGMMMLATGSATDTAEATRIINDLRATKAAGILLYMDQGQSWNWADSAGTGSLNATVGQSLDEYMDRPLFSTTAADRVYDVRIARPATLEGSDRTNAVLIGFNMAENTGNFTQSVRAKLARNARRIGLYHSNGNIYTGGTPTGVFMILH